MKPILIIYAPKQFGKDAIDRTGESLKSAVQKNGLKDEYHVLVVKSEVLDDWDFKIIKP